LLRNVDRKFGLAFSLFCLFEVGMFGLEQTVNLLWHKFSTFAIVKGLLDQIAEDYLALCWRLLTLSAFGRLQHYVLLAG